MSPAGDRWARWDDQEPCDGCDDPDCGHPTSPVVLSFIESFERADRLLAELPDHELPGDEPTRQRYDRALTAILAGRLANDRTLLAQVGVACETAKAGFLDEQWRVREDQTSS